MREKTTNGQVIIVYTEHPVFGILLIPRKDSITLPA